MCVCERVRLRFPASRGRRRANKSPLISFSFRRGLPKAVTTLCRVAPRWGAGGGGGCSGPRASFLLTGFDVAVVPGNGRAVGVTPGPVFVFIRVPAVAPLLAGHQQAPLAAASAHTHANHQADFITKEMVLF